MFPFKVAFLIKFKKPKKPKESKENVLFNGSILVCFFKQRWKNNKKNALLNLLIHSQTTTTANSKLNPRRIVLWWSQFNKTQHNLGIVLVKDTN